MSPLPAGVVSTGQQQALARLADFSRREQLDSAEQAELLGLLVVVSPAEVQRLERRWVLSRIGTILGGLMMLPVGLIAAAGAFALFVYLPVVFWMFVGSFVLYWPATALGIEPLVAFAGLHALAGIVWAYRRLPDSLAGFQALGRRLRARLAACRGALRTTREAEAARLRRWMSLADYRDRALLKMWEEDPRRGRADG